MQDLFCNLVKMWKTTLRNDHKNCSVEFPLVGDPLDHGVQGPGPLRGSVSHMVLGCFRVWSFGFTVLYALCVKRMGILGLGAASQQLHFFHDEGYFEP